MLSCMYTFETNQVCVHHSLYTCKCKLARASVHANACVCVDINGDVSEDVSLDGSGVVRVGISVSVRRCLFFFYVVLSHLRHQ